MEDIEIRLQDFINKIDDWAYSNNIQYKQTPFTKNDEVIEILDCNVKDLKDLVYDEYQENIMILNQYRNHISHILAREKAAKTWADQGINYLIAGHEFDKFMKWEEKYFITIRKSKVGQKLQELKTISDARIMSAEVTIKTIETAIKVLENLARSKYGS